MKVVQDKENEMSSRINDFRHAFRELFEDGLPSFWDEERRLFSQEHYHSLLVQNRMDDSKFDDLVKGLTGKIIMDKLTEDFEILQKILIMRGGFHAVSYEAFVLSLSILTPLPNGYVYCFNHMHNVKVLIIIYGLVKIIFERSLSGKEIQFLSEVVFCCYLWDLPFATWVHSE